MVENEIGLEDIPIDFDTLAAVGSMAGSGGVIVMDDTRDMVWALNNINEFYAHESCGQCTPCREGSLWMKKITERMLHGGGVEQDPARSRAWPTTSPDGRSAPLAKPAPGLRKASSPSSAMSLPNAPRNQSHLRFRRNTHRRN